MKLLRWIEDILSPNPALARQIERLRNELLIEQSRVAALEGDLQRAKEDVVENFRRAHRAEQTLWAIDERLVAHGPIGPTTVSQAYQDAKAELS